MYFVWKIGIFHCYVSLPESHPKLGIVFVFGGDFFDPNFYPGLTHH